VIHQRSGGIPRTISVLCDNALMSGFAVDQRPVGRQLVLEVCRDFDFETPLAPPGPQGIAPRPSAAVPIKPAAAPPASEAPARHERQAEATPKTTERLFATFGRPARSWFSK
jgi:hypothetical protein